jgi:tRNA(Met) cytidine acetyltransferase
MNTRSQSATDAYSAGARATLRRLLQLAYRRRHRQLLVLAGDRGWCGEIAQDLLGEAGLHGVHWFSDRPPQGVDSSHGAQALRLLGMEIDALVFDAWSGFDPDAFGALSGTVRAGGLLVLLAPSLREWCGFNDPVNRRITVAPYHADSLSARFVRRLVRVIEADRHAVVFEQGKPLPPEPRWETPSATVEPVEPPYLTVDQKRAVQAILKVVTGHRRRPVVLTSDRGRGKSAAFGIAAAQLIESGRTRILLTGPRPESVQAVLAQVRALAVGRAGSVCFVAPDVLVREHPRADLLLVDEAAAIPAPILQHLLKSYSRIAFATTVHGYEGTGRGFAVRFTRILDRESNAWNALQLLTPIRWAGDDPVERLVFRALLLDANAAPDALLQDADCGRYRIERIDRDALIDDERDLSELFGLLVLAHYRTRPLDLRHMLDGPNVSIFVLRIKGHVAGTVLLADEGRFDAAAAQAIWAGSRRPHGHLLPETLSAHLGLRDAARLRCARIMRIAVHPAVQGRGLGSALIRHLTDRARADGYDYIGSSFAAAPDLSRFWRRHGWLPVRVSIQRSASSGAHSVVMLRALNAAGDRLLRRARERFFTHFPHQLSDSLREMDVQLVRDLLHDAASHSPSLEEDDRRDIRAFACHRRQPEAAIGSLWKLACMALMNPRCAAVLDAQDIRLLVTRILQKHDWQRTAHSIGLPGQAQAVARLRTTARRLLDC